MIAIHPRHSEQANDRFRKPRERFPRTHRPISPSPKSATQNACARRVIWTQRRKQLLRGSMKSKYRPTSIYRPNVASLTCCSATWWASQSLLPDSIPEFCRRPFASTKTHAPRRLPVREEAKIALNKLLQIRPDCSPDAALAAYSPSIQEFCGPF